MCEIHHNSMMLYEKQEYKEKVVLTIKLSIFLNYAAIKEKQTDDVARPCASTWPVHLFLSPAEQAVNSHWNCFFPEAERRQCLWETEIYTH